MMDKSWFNDPVAITGDVEFIGTKWMHTVPALHSHNVCRILAPMSDSFAILVGNQQAYRIWIGNNADLRRTV